MANDAPTPLESWIDEMEDTLGLDREEVCEMREIFFKVTRTRHRHRDRR